MACQPGATGTIEGKTTLKDIQEPETTEIADTSVQSPQGIGMAVAFDWGLAVQILATPFFTLFGQNTLMKSAGLNSTPAIVLFFIFAILVAGGLVLFGEMIRNGRNWARRIQIVANILLSLVGLFSLIHLYQSVRVGNFWPLVTEVILVIFSPLIVWRLSRPVTARWFQTITAPEARKRHGGRWVWFIALWAIVGGLLQAIAAMK